MFAAMQVKPQEAVMTLSTRVRSLSCILRRIQFFLLFVSLMVSLSAATFAQELAATLTGTVTDPSGALVAGATVLVHSDETGADVRTVATSGTGNFNITNIPAGRYTVTVSNAGFQTFVAKDVILNVAEKHTLDVQLSTGKTTEHVEVTAENTVIQTTTAEQSGTVTGDQLRELALNNRNFEQLVLLQPGVANQLGDEPGFGLSSNTAIAINGARMGANNWTVDGADINDSGSNGTLLNTPSIDAIQEFTLERSNYDASFGRSGGGQVVVATKSGTSQFHGSAYEFNRNNYYNANTFENRQAIDQTGYVPGIGGTGTPIERYNDWGFTIGGPLFIPKLYHPDKDKTFFFWSEEWRHSSLPGSTEIPVPTQAQLNGVFNTPITVFPTGCVTTAGTGTNETWTVSPSCYSQNASAYLKAFMLPNPPNVGANELDESYTELNNFRQDIIRLDQNVGDKVRVFGRYMQDSVPENFPFGLWGTANYPGADPISLNAPGRNLVFNATASISPRVVNEVEFADSWGAINAALSGFANSPAFTSQLTGKTAYQDPYGRAPNVTISGYTGLTNGNGPYFERNIDKNIFDNLSIQHGNHTFRFGATAMWMTKTENATSGEATFTFAGPSPTNENNPFANFLLGQASGYSQPSKDTIPHLNYVNFEFYVQDDWKVTPRLTLNLGIRYSYFPSPTDSNHTLLNFDPATFSASSAPTIITNPDNPDGIFASGNAATYANGLIFPTGPTCAAAQAIPTEVGATCSPYGSRVNPSANNNWGPRFGLAYDPFGNGKWAVRAGFGIFYDRTLNGIWEQNAFDDPPLVQTTTVDNNGTSSLNLFDNYAVGAAGATPVGPSGLITTGAGWPGQAPTFKVPSYLDYNVSVQHEVMPNTVVEVAYVGTKGSHLLGDIDYNQPTVATRVANPGVGINGIAPFAGFSNITARDTVFTSNYNSLQATLTRRLSHGLQVGVAYTWSKLLGTNYEDRGNGAYDTYDLKQSYGLSTTNTPQMLSLNYVYQEPFFKGQHGLGWVLGGWELSGIVTVQSGQSLSVTQNTDPWALVSTNNTTLACTAPPCPLYPGGIGIGPSTILPRANQTGGSSGPKTVNQFFNTAAFSDAVGQFGTAAAGSVLGPGYQRWDTSLFKNFRFGERVSLQLRLETFNTFNHGSPSTIDTNVDDQPTVLTPPYPGTNPFGDGNSTYGTVTAYHIPRNVQIGGKIIF
jgi:Carboxypeptidase regulatory-like domain/TonB-dependent Receptor Plug Domain